MKQDELRSYLEFYQDLGIHTLIRREAVAQEAQPPVLEEAVVESAVSEPEPAPMRQALSQLIAELPPLVPSDDTLDKIRADIGECTRCRLCRDRKKIVFGDGNPRSRIVFVGEGPGADEDEQGIPFVGRAGQLLTQMIDNTAAKEGFALRRADAYICNVVKCRPPENRTPEPDEMEICGQFLHRQLLTIKPKCIVALGGTAAKALLNTKEGVTKLRGRWHRWKDIPVMVTWHPSYLLRPYNQQQGKREAWQDLKAAFEFLYDDTRSVPEL